MNECKKDTCCFAVYDDGEGNISLCSGSEYVQGAPSEKLIIYEKISKMAGIDTLE